jgi:drug/metabolite transporter (DMT)-like permease
MSHNRSNLRGIAYILVATCCFILNDSLLKIAMATVAPFEALFLRAVFGVALGIPVLIATGMIDKAKMMFRPSVVARNFFEFAAAAGYIFAIAFAPLADITALGQLTPMLVILGAVMFFGDKIGRATGILIAVAFIGAILVAQPGGAGFQPFALLGLWSALGVAIRDLIGRSIHHEVPALVVAVGASVVSLVGIGILMLIFERFTIPGPEALLCIIASAALLTLGQLMLFSAYRVGEMGVVAPFMYASTVWALLLGAVVFNTVPNALALVGIAMIVVSGVLVVLFDRRARRAAVPE